jgi:flavin reductase (DIM6/NTAB) family NADH-FMN oxidoreductase RutF
VSKDVKYNEYAAKAIEDISKGAFLTTAHGGKTNTMTIGWGSIGFIWNKPIFTVLVRPSRFTHGLIEPSGEFTVSFPFEDMKEALSLCGTKSGRDLDKIKAAGLALKPGQKVATPVIGCKGLHYECKVVYKQNMDPAALDGDYKGRCYPNGDYHTVYYGEILACYITE